MENKDTYKPQAPAMTTLQSTSIVFGVPHFFYSPSPWALSDTTTGLLFGLQAGGCGQGSDIIYSPANQSQPGERSHKLASTQFNLSFQNAGVPYPNQSVARFSTGSGTTNHKALICVLKLISLHGSHTCSQMHKTYIKIHIKL